ncbi:MAG: MBL fold metallo-hydrolase [Rubrivivax sp.]|nr:MAG: MBL fold metallo-hydrolase [Rubrivivax sp.]
MRIHHLNCISSCPLGGRLMDGRTPSVVQRGELCCHCLLLETSQGLVLVDTGYGLNDVRNPGGRLSPLFLSLLKPALVEEMTAVRQIQRLGYTPGDVRHIVLTHLDFDHAGGLDDFPQATVHLMRSEREHAFMQSTWLDRQRFRPKQWAASRHRWHAYEPRTGDTWHGFGCVKDLKGLPPEVLLVPLVGHTLGHAGVAIDTDGHWLLHAGDAYFYHREMDLDSPWCTPGLRLYQTLMEKDRRARLQNQERLRELKRNHSKTLTVFGAHDTVEFERLSGRAASA